LTVAQLRELVKTYQLSRSTFLFADIEQLYTMASVLLSLPSVSSLADISWLYAGAQIVQKPAQAKADTSSNAAV